MHGGISGRFWILPVPWVVGMWITGLAAASSIQGGYSAENTFQPPFGVYRDVSVNNGMFLVQISEFRDQGPNTVVGPEGLCEDSSPTCLWDPSAHISAASFGIHVTNLSTNTDVDAHVFLTIDFSGAPVLLVNQLSGGEQETTASGVPVSYSATIQVLDAATLACDWCQTWTGTGGVSGSVFYNFRVFEESITYGFSTAEVTITPEPATAIPCVVALGLCVIWRRLVGHGPAKR